MGIFVKIENTFEIQLDFKEYSYTVKRMISPEMTDTYYLWILRI